MPGVENISFHTTEAVFDFIDKNIGDEKLVLVIVTDLMNCHGFAYMNCHQIDWFSVISQPHRAAA